jgi:putative transposase
VDKEQAGGGTNYLGEVIDYIHLNPLRAGMVSLGEGKGLMDYSWSSLAQGYAVSQEKRPGWLVVGDGLLYHGLKDEVSGRKSYVEELERRYLVEGGSAQGKNLISVLERSWYWGSEIFKEKLLKMITKPTGSNQSYQSSQLHFDKAETQAEALIAGKAVQARMLEVDLIALPNGNTHKMELAFELATKTTLNQRWIAKRLNMKSAANVSRIVSEWRSRKAPY